MIRHKLFLLIIIVLIFISSICFSQNSLKQREMDFYAQIDSLRLNPNKLSLNYHWGRYNKDSLAIYYQEVYQTFNNVQDGLNKAQEVYWLYEIGYLQIVSGLYIDAEKTYEEALELLNKKNEDDWNAAAFVSYYLADACRATGKSKKSNEVFLSILPMLHQDSTMQMQVKACVSETYESLGEYDEAMNLCILLYNYHLRNEKYTPASYNLIQMGRISSFIESDTSYFEYYHMANELALKAKDTARLSNNLVNMGMAYRSAGYQYLGLKYLKQAELYYHYQRPYGRAHLLLALSSAYYGVDSVEQAIFIAKKALHDVYEINVFALIYDANLQLAKYYESINEYDSARRYILLAVSDSRSLDHKGSTQNLYKQLSDMSIRMNDYPNAVAYLDSSYVEYKNSVSRLNKDKLLQLRKKSDYYIHRYQITQLVSDNQLAQEKSKMLLITIIGILFVLGLIIYFTAVFRKRLQQLKESHVNLVKKNIELDKINKQLNHCEKDENGKAKHEPISGEELIINEFKKLMFNESIFVDPKLSLKSLADQLNTNTSYLSAIINTHFNCNFRTLVNKHRIDKARKMLTSVEYENYSMEGIASEVGFNSRSGFYQAFKATTGLSPSLYIENYKLAVSE